jgi:hypothetical protein
MGDALASLNCLLLRLVYGEDNNKVQSWHWYKLTSC